MLISWINVLQALLAVLSCLLGYYLFTTRRCHAMTVFLFGLALHNILRLAGDLGSSEQLIDIGNSLRFLYAPLVYFIARELLYEDFNYRPVHLWHLLPFAGAILLSIFAPALAETLAPAVGLLTVAYLAASYRLIWRVRRIISRTRSSGEPVGLRWLQRILHTYSLLILFEIARAALGLVMSPELTSMAHMLFLIVICLLLTHLVLQAMRRPALLPAVETGEQVLALEKPDTAPSRTTDPGIADRLEAYMAEQKPYLNPQLTVGDLAAELDIPGRTLSEVINDSHCCNFSEFINRARVEEAQSRIRDPEQAAVALLDIGLAVGFNSKTSFNVMFKRYTGLTPSAYRRRQETASSR